MGEVVRDDRSTSDIHNIHTIEGIQSITKKAAQLLYEIKDVRDELNILKTIAEYQQKVQSHLDSRGPNAVSAEWDEDLTAEYVKSDIKEMERLAEWTEEDVGRISTTRGLAGADC